MAAPLKCKKSAVAKPIFFQKFGLFSRSRVFRPLSILLLTAILSFTHCSSDNGGGGGGGGSNPNPSPSPPPAPVTTPIYAWETGCTVQGNMMGGTCGNMADGRDGADALCAARYETDGGSAADRMRISEERGTPAHKALLADSNLLPQNFDINNKENREVQRPDGTLIADTYTYFPSTKTDWNVKINPSGAGNYVWVGWGVLPGPADAHFTNVTSCDDWTSSANSVKGGVGSDLGRVSGTGVAASPQDCDGTYFLYCITY